MSDPNTFGLEDQNIIHHAVAPDPTANLESSDLDKDKQNSHNNSGFNNFVANIKAYGPKHYMARLISLVLIIHGLTHLYEQIHELLFVFPKIPEVYKAFNFSDEIYRSLLYRSAIITATGIVNTVYGIGLAFKHSHVVEYFHVIAGVGLFIASYFLLRQVPPLEINEMARQAVAFLLHF